MFCWQAAAADLSGRCCPSALACTSCLACRLASAPPSTLFTTQKPNRGFLLVQEVP